MANLPVEIFVDLVWRNALLQSLTEAADFVLEAHYRISARQVVHA
jgi:hypothetical protein